MSGTVSGTGIRGESRTLYRMPRDGYTSISVREAVHTRAQTLTNGLDATWSDIVMAGAEAVSDEGEGVRVNAIDASVLDEVANRVSRSVREELDGGRF